MLTRKSISKAIEPMTQGHQENKPSRFLSGFTPVLSKIQELLNFLVIRCFLVPAIRIYQYAISPLLGPHCRFTPTCSQYALEALQVHGFWRGMGLTIYRVSRCHPWSQGGNDPVPNAKTGCSCSDSIDMNSTGTDIESTSTESTTIVNKHPTK